MNMCVAVITLIVSQPCLCVGQIINVLRGRALDYSTREPLPEAVIDLAPLGAGTPFRTVTADDGTFALPVTMSGRFRLLGTAPGYSQRKQSRLIVPIIARSSLPSVVVEFDRNSSISGAVLGDGDAPLHKAVVSAIHVDEGENGRTTEALTDDHGAFKLSGLTPGTFVLRAVYSPPEDLLKTFGVRILSKSAAKPFLLPTFYPAAAELAEAERMVLAPGQRLHNIAIRMRSGTAAGELSGRVLGTPDDAKGLLFLLTQIASGQCLTIAAVTPVTNGRSFRFAPVPPGRYVMYGRLGSNTVSHPFDMEPGVHGAMEVTAFPDVMVSGQVVGLSQTAVPYSVRLSPNVCAPLLPAPLSASLSTDGTFRLSAVPATDYELSVIPLKAGQAIESIIANGQPIFTDGENLLEPRVIVQGKPLSLRVGITKTRQTVAGRILLPDNSPVGSMVIDIVSVNGSRQSAESDILGAFIFPLVRPGRARIEPPQSPHQYHSSCEIEAQDLTITLSTEPTIIAVSCKPRRSSGSAR